MTFVGGKSAETVILAGSNSGSIFKGKRFKAVNVVADLNATMSRNLKKPVSHVAASEP